MISGIYAISIVTLVCLFLAYPARVFGFLSAVSIFFYAQAIMGLGILPLLDAEIPADRIHARIILGTLVAYTVTIFVGSIVKDQGTPSSLTVIKITKPTGGVLALLGLSIAISAVYFLAVGHVALFESIRGLYTGEEVDSATLRIESYSGGKYYFPGYVNQFKNSLLPALTIVIVHFLYSNGSRHRGLISALLVTTALIFLLGTGQRGAFVKFVLIVVVYVLMVNRRKFMLITTWIGVLALSLFFISTAASGRAAGELASANSGLEQLKVLFGQLFYRLSGSNQASAVAGFRYIYDLPVQHGGEWLKSILGLLPGVAGSDLDSRIFATLYGGSTRGTSPPSLWGSVYHNFGEIGCLVLAISFAVLLLKISAIVSNSTVLNTFQAIGLAGLTVIAGSWIAGSPVYLFNFGIVVYIALWFYGNLLEKRTVNSG